MSSRPPPNRVPPPPPPPQQIILQAPENTQLPSYYKPHDNKKRPRIEPRDLILAKKNLSSSNPSEKCMYHQELK